MKTKMILVTVPQEFAEQIESLGVEVAKYLLASAAYTITHEPIKGLMLNYIERKTNGDNLSEQNDASRDPISKTKEGL